MLLTILTAENTKDGLTTHATSHIFDQYNNVEHNAGSIVAVPLNTSMKTTVINPTRFVVLETGVSLKNRRNTRSLAGLKLTESDPHKNVFLNLNLVWQLLRMNYDASDTPVATPQWRTFYKMLIMDKPADSTTIFYGPLSPEMPTNTGVIQASLDYFRSAASKLDQSTADQAIYDIVNGRTQCTIC